MNDIYNAYEDLCITAGDLQKAVYYKWLRADGQQRDRTIVLSPRNPQN